MSDLHLPIFIKNEKHGIVSIHFPGEDEYDAIESAIKKFANDFYLGFEQAAEKLGFELGKISRSLV